MLTINFELIYKLYEITLYNDTHLQCDRKMNICKKKRLDKRLFTLENYLKCIKLERNIFKVCFL